MQFGSGCGIIIMPRGSGDPTELDLRRVCHDRTSSLLPPRWGSRHLCHPRHCGRSAQGARHRNGSNPVLPPRVDLRIKKSTENLKKGLTNRRLCGILNPESEGSQVRQVHTGAPMRGRDDTNTMREYRRDAGRLLARHQRGA